MTIELIRDALGWCSIFNIGLLLWWWGWIALAHDWVYRFHVRCFSVSREQFDVIHYAGMAFFKLCIIVFNLVPYFALRIVE